MDRIELTKRRLLEDLPNLRSMKLESNASLECIIDKQGYLFDVYVKELVELAYANCENISVAMEKIYAYVDNYRKEQTSFKKPISPVIEHLVIIIQHLTETSYTQFEKNKENLEEAVRKIALKKTKSAINCGRNMKFYELIPIINRCDSFKPWKEDHLNSQIKIWLTLENENFPSIWKTCEKTIFEIRREEIYQINFESSVRLEHNLNILSMDLRELLNTQLRFQDSEADRIMAVFDSKSITSVEELITLSEDAWTHLYQSFPTKVMKIRDELGKASSPHSDLDIKSSTGKKTLGEELGDWHKTLRFLYYEAEMWKNLAELGWLSREALKAGLKEQQESSSFNGGPMLSQIEKAFESFVLKPNERESLSHGMLMYGPPGTGKTSLINVIIRKVGLKKLVEPFASTELNKGIVGETEKTIRDIIRRGFTYPYLLCCVAIDEIDAIVPKRDGNPNQRIDSLTQFLTLIGGVDDVRNVYMIGATNRFNKIDDAFLRRLNDKFYVGCLDSPQRLDLLRSIAKEACDRNLKYDFLDENEQLIKVLTTNFSGAATSTLKSEILKYVRLKYEPDAAEIQLSTDELIDIIHKVAFSFKFKFSGMTLAELVRKDPNIDRLNEKWDKRAPLCLERSTGRIIIDLTEDVLSMQFELRDGQLYELKLSEEVQQIRFLSDIVPFLLCLCIYLNIEFVRVIDTDYKILQGAEEKSSTLSLILDCFIDFDNYENGMLVFDGDTIVGVNDSGKIDDAMTDDLSRSISDQDVWKNCIIHIFRKLANNANKKEKNPEEEEDMATNAKPVQPWCIFVTSHKFLVDSFKNAVKFPLSQKEKQDKETDRENRETVRTCKNCDKLYYEKDNNLESCSFHSDYLTNIKGDYSIRITQHELYDIVREEKNTEIMKNYVWFCCMKEFGSSDGCKKNRHSDTKETKRKEAYKKKDLVQLEEGFYSIESLSTSRPDRRKYVQTVSDCTKSLNASEEESCEPDYFKFIKAGSSPFNYVIKAKSNDKYLRVESCGLHKVLADSYIYYNNDLNKDHFFNIVIVDKDKDVYAIQSAISGYYIRVQFTELRANGNFDGNFEKFIIKKLDIIVDQEDNENFKTMLSGNFYSIASILNNKNVTMENEGFSPLKAVNDVIREAQIFKFVPAEYGKFMLQSVSNKKFVSIDGEERLVCKESDCVSNYSGLFDVRFVKSDSSRSLVCFKSYSNKYVQAETSSRKYLIANSYEIDESSIFRINNQNNFIRTREINIKKENDLSVGFYRIKSKEKNVYVDFKSNNMLRFNNEDEYNIFKFICTNENQVYEIKSKFNEMCVSLENVYLFANSNVVEVSNQRRFKIEACESVDSRVKIQSMANGSYLMCKTKDENMKNEETMLVTSDDRELKFYFYLERVNLWTEWEKRNNAELKKLNNNSFKMQTFLQNKNIFVQRKGFELLKFGEDWVDTFEFIEQCDNSFQLVLKKNIYLYENNSGTKKYLTVNNENKLIISKDIQFFSVCFMKFDKTVICLKSQKTNKFVRPNFNKEDCLENNYLLADSDDVDEAQMFRITCQNNFVRTFIKI